MTDDPHKPLVIDLAAPDSSETLLPVVILLSADEWDALTDHLRGYLRLGLDASKPDLDLRSRVEILIRDMIAQGLEISHFDASQPEPGRSSEHSTAF